MAEWYELQEVQLQSDTNDMRTMMRAIDRGVGKLAMAGLLAVAVAGCANGEATENVAATTAVRLVSVQVTEVQPEAFTDFVRVVATVEANQDVTVSAQEAGTIREILVDKGSVVRAGQPIARIDDGVLRPQAEQAAAEAALARETWERQQRLWEVDRVGSEIAYLQARYRAETAAAGARALQERLERTVIRSPIAGVLDDRFVEVGTLVAPGAPVARVIDTGRVVIGGGVPERYAGQIEPGTEVEISIDGVGNVAFSETVDFVGASVDPQSRTFPIEIEVQNPGATLKPGMIANVQVARATTTEALVVPQEAVLRVEDGYIVYVAETQGGDTIAAARPIALGSAQGDRVIVDAGLQAGDRVVVVGQNQVARGDRLEVVGSENGGAR